MENAFEIKDLRVSVDGKSILDGVDLTIGQGETFAIVGPNGAGKSTLLKCLDMLHEGWSGCISLNGKELRSYSRRGLARCVAYVPQLSEELPDYAVRDFVALGRYAWDGDDGAVERALEAVGMSDFSARRLGSLSGGELQKVSIASALAQETDVLLLDEPTAFLDPKYSQQVWRLLSALKNDRPRTIVTVTHDINSACAFADRICGLKDGRLFAVLPPRDFMDKTVLEGLFDASFEIVNAPDGSRRIVL